MTDILQRLKNLAEVQRHFENTIYADAATEIERLRSDPEADLFSDAMDRAASTFHSVMHGARKNAERANEPMDGEKLVRRALAAAFRDYVAEITG